MAENVDLMVKLFETLKQSSDKNEATLQKLIEQQHSLIGHIEYLPIKDLQIALKDHNKESSNDISTCTDTVNTTTDTILEKVKQIDGKVGKMITVVLVAFSLLTITFVIARMTIDTELIDKKIHTVISSKQQHQHDEIVKAVKESMQKEFKKIQDRMTELHKNDKGKIDDKNDSEKKFR
jgi:predicted PurR-regulated permease PerM